MVEISGIFIMAIAIDIECKCLLLLAYTRLKKTKKNKTFGAKKKCSHLLLWCGSDERSFQCWCINYITSVINKSDRENKSFWPNNNNNKKSLYFEYMNRRTVNRYARNTQNTKVYTNTTNSSSSFSRLDGFLFQ